MIYSSPKNLMDKTDQLLIITFALTFLFHQMTYPWEAFCNEEYESEKNSLDYVSFLMLWERKNSKSTSKDYCLTGGELTLLTKDYRPQRNPILRKLTLSNNCSCFLNYATRTDKIGRLNRSEPRDL